MRREMVIAYFGDADVHFLGSMIAHHEGAVAMANFALQHGQTADVQSLARAIIAAWEAETVIPPPHRHASIPRPVTADKAED